MKDMEVLSKGSHLENGHACVMEAAAYIAGEKWSDAPECVSPIIRGFMVNWNDSIPNDETRTRLIAPLITDILGTRGSEESEAKRSWMAFDWLVRECGPVFMDLTDSLKPHAKALRDLGPIYDSPTLAAASPTIEAAHKASAAAWAAARDAAWAAAGAAARDAAGAAARAAAWAAARDAARDAARAAARDAAWVAAGAAARDAAWAAAGAAARDAAWDAAWAAARAAARDAAWAAAGAAARVAAGAAARDAAWAAAGAAARDAAWDAAWAAARAAARDAAGAALAPTVLALQASAVDLVRRMAEIERVEFKPVRALRINGFEFAP